MASKSIQAPIKFKTQASQKKEMVISFFDYHDLIYQNYVLICQYLENISETFQRRELKWSRRTGFYSWTTTAVTQKCSQRSSMLPSPSPLLNFHLILGTWLRQTSFSSELWKYPWEVSQSLALLPKRNGKGCVQPSPLWTSPMPSTSGWKDGESVSTELVKNQ